MIKEFSACILAGIFLVELSNGQQQYWPGRQYWPQWRPRYSAGQPVPNYYSNGSPSRNGYGYPNGQVNGNGYGNGNGNGYGNGNSNGNGYGNGKSNGNGMSQYQGTIWRSGWIPAKNLPFPVSGISHNYPGYSPEKTFTDYEARNYVERFFPSLLEHDSKDNSQPQPQPHPPYQAPYYPSYKPPYNNPEQYDPNEDPASFPEVIATCEQKHCYLSCRLGLLGGGRCTKAGCMCYMSFFDSDGSPTSNFHPEDNIWFDLSEKEREDIREAIREGRITSGPATARPPYTSTSRPTYRPPYTTTTRSTGRPTYVTTTTRSTSRPTYVTTTTRSTARPPYITTTTKKPIGDSDFFGGDDNDDDNDDDDVEDDFGLK